MRIPGAYIPHNDPAGFLSVHVTLFQLAALSERDEIMAGSGIPTSQPRGRLLGGHTGVIVVSSHPQSTARPVIRPHAANASRLDGVNDTEGT